VVGVSTIGKPQVIIFQKLESTSSIDISTAENHKIKFGAGKAVLLGTIEIIILLGNITFYMFLTNIILLFCFQDIDRIGIKLNNLKNILVQGNKIVLVVCKWGYLYLLFYYLDQSIA
jgi:hypothetical protein